MSAERFALCIGPARCILISMIPFELSEGYGQGNVHVAE